ncbi:MAG: hypothetical protein EAY75_16485 [Bacteroidetes bacterium]|nr:MAG: hypothetical protein EAY75_16485 [Bacteroidota bacterium]
MAAERPWHQAPSAPAICPYTNKGVNSILGLGNQAQAGLKKIVPRFRQHTADAFHHWQKTQLALLA